MSISLNNHESRIKALENKTSNMGSGSIKLENFIDNVTNLIFKLGVTTTQTDTRPRVTYRTPFPNKTLFVILQGTHSYYNGSGNSYSVEHSYNYSRDGFNINEDGFGQDIYWLAIGYLVSNRILSSFISPLKEVF